MICPFCNNYFTIVSDTRETDNGRKVKRRRKCTKCNKKFTTYEIMESEANAEKCATT